MLQFIREERRINTIWREIENVLPASNKLRVNQKVFTRCKFFALFLISIITHKWVQVHINVLNSRSLAMLRFFVILQRVVAGKFFSTIWALCPSIWIWHCMLRGNVVIEVLLRLEVKIGTLWTCFCTSSTRFFVTRDKFVLLTLVPQ